MVSWESCALFGGGTLVLRYLRRTGESFPGRMKKAAMSITTLSGMIVVMHASQYVAPLSMIAPYTGLKQLPRHWANCMTAMPIVAAMADWFMIVGANGRRPPPPNPPQMPIKTIPIQMSDSLEFWNSR